MQKHITTLCIILVLSLYLSATGATTGKYSYQTRQTKNPLGEARHRHISVNLGDGKIGVFAGFGKKTVELFDTSTETFRTLPCEQHFGDLNGIGVAPGKALLVDGKNDCVFDLATESFTKTKNTFTTNYVRWAGMTPMEEGKIFLAGGFDGGFDPIDDCAVFDLAENSFAAVGTLNTPRANATVNRIGTNTFLIAGGSDADSKNIYDTLEVFDLALGRSKALTTRLGSTMHRHVSANLKDGRIFLAGCHTSSRKLPSAQYFDPKSGKIIAVTAPAANRYDPQSAIMPSGRVAIFGGKDGARVIEVFDPETGKFSIADQLMIDARRSGFTVTPLDNGDILIVGGRPDGSSTVLGSAEIFSETRLPTSKEQTEPVLDVEKLIQQLGHNTFAIREAAQRELIDLGPDVEKKIRPYLKSKDPEIAERAAAVITALTGSISGTQWRVEFWKDDNRAAIQAFDDCTVPRYRKVDDPRVVKVSALAKEHNATHLVIRFEKKTQHAEQVGLMGLVGWTDLPIIRLGPALD